MTTRIIGIGGTALAGKDTLCNLLIERIPHSKRFALADALKLELNPYFKKLYNIDIFNCSAEQKSVLRPIMVAHGKMRREESLGRYWMDILTPKIKDYLDTNPEGVAIITDIRFEQHPKAEVFWLKNELGGVLVHIQRYTQSNICGEFKKCLIPPNNEEESINDPKIYKAANYRICWPTANTIEGKPDFDSLNIYAEEFIKYLHR